FRLKSGSIAPSPSGKAPDSDSGIRRFESFRGCHFQPVPPPLRGAPEKQDTASPPRAGLRVSGDRPVPAAAFRSRRLSMVAIFPAPFTPAEALLPAMRGHGYAVLAPDAVAALCDVAVADLDALKPSWDALPADEYLLDGGSYRRRRHACFVVDGDRFERAPHRAHWQSKDYNALHGGLRRWFEPVDDAVAGSAAWSRLLLGLSAQVSRLEDARPWYVEAHQFRIDTSDGI